VRVTACMFLDPRYYTAECLTIQFRLRSHTHQAQQSTVPGPAGQCVAVNNSYVPVVSFLHKLSKSSHLFLICCRNKTIIRDAPLEITKRN